jgi:hypothetical protein
MKSIREMRLALSARFGHADRDARHAVSDIDVGRKAKMSATRVATRRAAVRSAGGAERSKLKRGLTSPLGRAAKKGRRERQPKFIPC